MVIIWSLWEKVFVDRPAVLPVRGHRGDVVYSGRDVL